MVGWICSTDFFGFPEVIKITGMQNGADRAFLQRTVILIKLLSMTSDGFKFSDVNDLRVKLNTGGRNKQTLDDTWKMCEENGIIRRDGDSFSALSWMVEKGLLANCAKKPSTRAEPRHASKDAPKPQEPPQNESSPKQTAVPEPKQTEDLAVRLKPIKEKVRPMVYLTRDEILELKNLYSDEEFSLRLDYLNGYKVRNQSRYFPQGYDMNALSNGWCSANRLPLEKIKSEFKLETKQPEKAPEKADDDWAKNIPDWMLRINGIDREQL